MKISDDNLPSVSIVIITYNSERTLPRVLASIKMQDYPKKKIEILAIDGNSTDSTLNLLQKFSYSTRIIQSKYPRDPEACRGEGLIHAKGEILSYIDSDNIMPNKSWLRKMIAPFVEQPEIVGTATLRFGYVKNDNYLNRYFALIGSADPVGLYLGKADKLSYVTRKWNLAGKILKHEKNYFVIKFTPQHFPTLGSNGFCARKKLLKKAHSDPEHYFHIDVPLDLAFLGYDTYGIVNESIIHDTAASPSVIGYVLKRANYMMLHYQKRAADRRYKVFDPGRTEDVLKIILFVLCASTFVQPLYISLKGYRKKQDLAWFIHPLFCFSIAVAYEYAILRRVISKFII